MLADGEGGGFLVFALLFLGFVAFCWYLIARAGWAAAKGIGRSIERWADRPDIRSSQVGPAPEAHRSNAFAPPTQAPPRPRPLERPPSVLSPPGRLPPPEPTRDSPQPNEIPALGASPTSGPARARAKQALLSTGLPIAALEHLATVDVGRELIIRAVHHSDPSTLVRIAAELFESAANDDPGPGVGSPTAYARSVRAESVSPRGRFLMWAGISRSLLGESELALDHLVVAANLFEQVAKQHGGFWTVPALTMQGRSLHEAGEAALAAGDEARAVELLIRSSQALSAAGDTGRSAVPLERSRNLKGTLPPSGFFGSSYGPPSPAVLGSSNAVRLRQEILRVARDS